MMFIGYETLNGIPSEEKLLELGLDECSEKMKAYR